MVAVKHSGRHRYYQLAGPEVAAAVEALARIAKPEPIKSLRQSTRAAALREARTCYDHLAGRLGVALLEGLVRRDALTRTDGGRGADRRPEDPLAQQLQDGPYALGPRATEVFGELGVDLSEQVSRRRLLRFCVDWSEQRHHLAGGRARRRSRRQPPGPQLDPPASAPASRRSHRRGPRRPRRVPLTTTSRPRTLTTTR